MPPYEVGNAPYGASYTPPRQDMSWLGDLPQTFYQGAAARRAYNLAGAFPEGMPKDAQGNPDFGEMTNRILKIAGPDAAGPIINKMMLMQMAQGMGNPENEPSGPTGGQPAQPTVTGGPRNTPNTGPAHLGARPAAVPPDQDHNAQGDNIRSLVTEHLPGAENPKLIQYLAGKMFPGDEQGDMRTLSPDQTQQVVKALTTYKSQSASAAGPPGPSPAGMAPGVGMPPQTGGQAAAQPGPSASGPAAAPVGPTPGPGPAPAGPYAQNSGGAMVAPTTGGSPGAGGEGGIPPEFSLSARTALDRKLQRYTQEAARRELVIPGSGKALEARMTSLGNQIKAIDEYRAKYYQRTPEQINATTSGAGTPLQYEQQKAIQATDTKRGESLNNGLQSMANVSAPMIENLRQQKAFVNNPEFTSGNFNEAELWLKRQMPTIFGQPTSMELYRKTLAENISREMDSLRPAAEQTGEAAGRIFLPQIQQIQTMSGGLDNSVTGLRALAEIRLRSHQRNIDLANFAADYKSGNLGALPPEFRKYPPSAPGLLGPGFERGMRDWMAHHPLFDDKETADPRVMGAREPPPLKTPEEVKAWTAKVGVKSGEPIRVNGKIRYAP